MSDLIVAICIILVAQFAIGVIFVIGWTLFAEALTYLRTTPALQDGSVTDPPV